jgi:PHD/YefM family antitoxin component YafN of YafNO toxin-antitoxin module
MVLPVALENLPTQASTEVKNRWGQVVRQVQKTGSLAITHHSNIEMVLSTAEHYQSLLDEVSRLQARERSRLEELSAQFMSRLDRLQQPDAHARLAGVMEAKGQASSPPIAGKSY